MAGGFTERGAIEHGFAPIYHGRIAPRLDALQRKREIAARKTKRDVSIIAAVAIAAALGLVIALGLLGAVLAALVLMFSLAGGLILSSSRSEDFGQQVIDIVMPEITAFLDLRYEPEGPDAAFVEPFRRLGILPRTNRTHLSHHIAGAHRGTQFELCRAGLVQKESGKDGKSYTLFSGLAARISVPAPAASPVLVGRDMGRFGNGLLESLSTSGRRSEHRVVMDDAAFEERFAVYCESDDIARRFVTPAFMRALLTIDDEIGGSEEGARVAAAFDGDDFYLALSRSGFLAPGSVFDGDLEDRIHRIFSDMTQLHGIIDRLHGDQPERSG